MSFQEEVEEHVEDEENVEEDGDEDDYEEKHVGFHLNERDFGEIEKDNTEFRLKRKDTPHFTKGKRIVQDDEEKALEILASIKSKGEGSSEGDGLALVDNDVVRLHRF